MTSYPSPRRQTALPLVLAGAAFILALWLVADRMGFLPSGAQGEPRTVTPRGDLADYEKLLHEVVATEEGLRESLFGERPAAEVILGEVDGQTAGFALFFHNYSTFLGRRGIYLEDLYVRRSARGLGLGRQLLRHLARLALERGCGRLDWWVLDWNETALGFLVRF